MNFIEIIIMTWGICLIPTLYISAIIIFTDYRRLNIIINELNDEITLLKVENRRIKAARFFEED